MSDLTPKGFSNGKYVDRFLLRDKLYEEDAITMGGVAILNNFPAANVAPVVRCKDCRKGIPDSEHATAYSCYGIWHKPDWFCADGERKDGDGE